MSQAINHKQAKQKAQQQRPCFLDQSGLRVSSFVSFVSPFIPSLPSRSLPFRQWTVTLSTKRRRISVPHNTPHCTPPATFLTSGQRAGSVAESFRSLSPSAKEAKGWAAKAFAAKGDGEVVDGECRTPEMIWLRRLACLVARLTARPGKDMMLVTLATLDGRRGCWVVEVSALLVVAVVVREKQARHGDWGKLARGQRWSIVMLSF